MAVVDNFDLSGLRKPRCALNLHFPEMMLINKTMIMKMMTRSITKTMLSGTLATMMTSWKNQHTLGCRMRAQSFLTSLMATWQTLMHPHLKLCVSKSEFSRSTRASVSCQGCPRLPSVLLLLALALLTAWLSHPLVANLQSLEARARSARGRDTIPRTRDHSLQTFVRWSLAKNTDLALGSLSTPMSKKRLTEIGTTRGGSHHAPRLRPGHCMLCRQVGRRASECANENKATSFSCSKRCIGHLCSEWCLCSIPYVSLLAAWQRSKKSKKIKK